MVNNINIVTDSGYMKWKVMTFHICPFNTYKYNIFLPILLFSSSFSILEIHKWNYNNSLELLSVEFIALLYPGGDLLYSCMHDNINIKVENLISQSKWGIVIYYC
jgi:hypothetical protein